MSNDMIKELTVTKLFCENVQYVIPLYQRAFAWGENEDKGKPLNAIKQLIDDIMDFEEENYYIGSLIVSKIKENEKKYEVIDGQQRLTALLLLFNALNEHKASLNLPDLVINDGILTFACREKSNESLKRIKNWKEIDVEPSLQNGKSVIDEIITESEFKKKKVHFWSQLKKVKLYRIELPPKTDLNRYFEIMNTRGEQLEQHDILKAQLMGYLDPKNEGQKTQFAKIWEACSDMTGYVQMHFDTKDRRTLFGGDWDKEPNVKDFLNEESNKGNDAEIASTIEKIINNPNVVDVKKPDGMTDKDESVRFESIIPFPYFLLHTLKVLVADKEKTSGKMFDCGSSHDDDELLHDDKKLSLLSLDDKKLTDTFKRVINDGMIGDKEIAKESFSIDFIECLLKTRFLFDKYIIKREYVNENKDGEWSLKQLVSDKETHKKAHYVNTKFNDDSEAESKHRNKDNLMIQSCLRVSYTSPKVMRWITELLKWLYLNERKNLQKLDEYGDVAKRLAAKAVWDDYLSKIQDEQYNWGTNTPHIVFNYLDYLLWREDSKKYEDFKFEFRNSVEHWYPQNPPEGTFEPWTHENGLDDFGNLCIVHRSTNSRLSNPPPKAKSSTYQATIKKESLKLRIMDEETCRSDWTIHVCRKHQNDMIEILKRACKQAGYQVDEVGEDGVV